MKRFLPFLIALAFLSSFLYSQSVRKVLVEEATNASCGPCATYNPRFQDWMNRNLDRIIPVIYHSWWPGGNDPMYRYDTVMNRSRVNYYSINSVPNGRLNGLTPAPSPGSSPGHIGDTIAWTRALATIPMYSPLSISIEMTHNQGTGTVKVEVSSEAQLTNKYLRVVICEEHHYYENAGNNGEKNFPFIARKMLPNPDGQLISLTKGETKSFEFDFSVDPSFADDIYAVAFVQDDITKEVLQANCTRSVPEPKLPDVAFVLNDFNTVFIGNPGEQFSTEIAIINNTDNTQIIESITLSDISGDFPSDWTISFNPEISNLNLPPKSKTKVSFSVTLGQNPSFSEFTADGIINGIKYSSLKCLAITSNFPRFHILGGEEQHSLVPIIENTIGKKVFCSLPSDIFENKYLSFSSLKTVIWNTSTTGQISQSSANAIQYLISAGANVLICGGRITAGLVSTGALPVFGVQFIAYCREGYGTPPYEVRLAGVPNDPITGDFGSPIIGNLISYLLPLYRITNPNITFPMMTFAKSADSIFAVRVQYPTSRAILMGMNPYILVDQSIRNKLISRSIAWLEGINNVDFNTQSTISSFTIKPNPTDGEFAIELYTEEPIDRLTIYLTDVLGRTYKSIQQNILQTGLTSIPIDAKDFPPGVYFVVVKTTDKQISQRVVIY